MKRRLIRLFVCCPLGCISLLWLLGAIGSLLPPTKSPHSSPETSPVLTYVLFGFCFALGLVTVRLWRGKRFDQLFFQNRLHNTTRLHNDKIKLSLDIRSKDPLLLAAKSITRQHIQTLTLEHRTRLVRDKYGIVDRTSWEREIDVFITRVAEPHIFSALTPKQYRKSTQNLTKGVLRQVPRAEQSGVIRAVLRSIVESEIAAHANNSKCDQRLSGTYSNPAEFEEWCASQLRMTGWNARVTGHAGDQGVDVLANTQDRILVLQCKHYTQPAGNGAVQEVFAGKAYYRANVAAVVCTAGFTKSARALAQQTGVYLLLPAEIKDFLSATHTQQSAA